MSFGGIIICLFFAIVTGSSILNVWKDYPSLIPLRKKNGNRTKILRLLNFLFILNVATLLAYTIIDIISKKIDANWPTMFLISLFLIIVVGIVEKLYLPELKAAK